jgi:transposase InsO family protein
LFFPLFQFEAVNARAVQQGLQQLFERWGLPQAIRVDNGQPWGCRSDLPSELMLWLIGLGVAVIHNRPYQPTDNARIERTHGTTKAWVEPSQCPDLTTLQHRLDWSANMQRAQYPSCSGHSRQQCYPQLTANPSLDLSRPATLGSQSRFHGPHFSVQPQLPSGSALSIPLGVCAFRCDLVMLGD